MDTNSMVVEAHRTEEDERALCRPTSRHVRVNPGLRAVPEIDVGEQRVWHGIHQGYEEASLEEPPVLKTIAVRTRQHAYALSQLPNIRQSFRTQAIHGKPRLKESVVPSRWLLPVFSTIQY